MKQIHLLCNAHLDPVWLWQWKEGVAETLSTFRVAAEFCEKYDGFIFNHNEALLYEWVEKYDQKLFRRIHKLVKENKWHIMGGWYLQPDCLMPSGESIIRQIEIGKHFFKEKFGIIPKTAMNVDSFGHSRGLVQILKKTGYDSYLFMRPTEMEYGDFIWEGYDGSRIVAHKIYKGYNTLKGQTDKKLEKYIKDFPDREKSLVLWGIGNHGGGASKVDLEQVNAFIAKHSEYHIMHSTPEEYFKKLDCSKLKVRKQSLVHCNVGCYTSMVRIKQLHRQLENKLYVTEKMLSHAVLHKNMKYPLNELVKIQKSLLFSEFHDILPGSMVHSSEKEELMRLSQAYTSLDELCTKAFFILTSGQKKARSGETPILVYNPHPYVVEMEIEVEFQLEDQGWDETKTTIGRVYDCNGTMLLTQNEKPECSINLDWRKKIVFRGLLQPSSMNRFDCKLKIVPKTNKKPCYIQGDYFIIKNESMEVWISALTGYIDKYKVNGIDYLKENSGRLEVFDDNEDPWGMTVDRFDKKIGEFTLLSMEDANSFRGYQGYTEPNINVIEDGEVRVIIQGVFQYKSSYAVIEYCIPKKDSYIDVTITTFINDVNKMIKYNLNSAFENPTYLGETMFGYEEMNQNGEEVNFQKWCSLEIGNKVLAVLNEGIYGGCAYNGKMLLSLLRTPAYSAHPIEERNIVPTDRYLPHIDMGERQFKIRIQAGEIKEKLSSLALRWNEKPYVLSYFPSGECVQPQKLVEIENEVIVLAAFRQIKEDTYLMRLVNESDKNCVTKINIEYFNIETKLIFQQFEVKTFVLHGTSIVETDMLGEKI